MVARTAQFLARKLLDQGKFEAAYQAGRATLPADEITGRISISRAAGVALRYRNDPATARAHSSHIDEGRPI